MAANLEQSLFQCSSCHGDLNLDSKTLPCLHSLCHACLKKHFEGETNENCQCPECHRPMRRNQLVLSPFLVKLIKCRHLETTEWRCDLCLEDGIKVHAKKWCHDCQKLLCANCSRIHKKFQPEHLEEGLDEIERNDVKKAIMTDMCTLHQKEKHLYCERCNACFCGDCYDNHSADSTRCSNESLSVKAEALKRKSEGPTLTRKIDHIEMNIRSVIERTRKYTEELNSNCNSRCEQMWQQFEEMMKNAKKMTEEMCEEIRQKTAEQVKHWNDIVEENEKVLKQLEIWRINLRHLLSDSLQDVDVVCGLQSLGTKLTSLLNKPIQTEEECQLEVSYSFPWLQALQAVKMIGSMSLKVNNLRTQHLRFNKLCDVNCCNSDISSIIVRDIDNHIFLSDCNNSTIFEYDEEGNFLCEETLYANFVPRDMCWISTDVFVVCGEMKYLVFMEIKEESLDTKEVVDTEESYYSVCHINDTIYACNLNFKFDSFTKEGQKIKTIKVGESWDKFSWPLLRADPFTEKIWATRIYSPQIFPFKETGVRILGLTNDIAILDFCVNECGHIYFCNFEGIFLLSPKKRLHKFEREPEELPKIFASRNKIFVSLKIDQKYFIEIFTICK